jgi:hypothetical protein
LLESRITASVLVPPTSTQMRYGCACTAVIVEKVLRC